MRAGRSGTDFKKFEDGCIDSSHYLNFPYCGFSNTKNLFFQDYFRPNQLESRTLDQMVGSIKHGQKKSICHKGQITGNQQEGKANQRISGLPPTGQSEDSSGADPGAFCA